MGTDAPPGLHFVALGQNPLLQRTGYPFPPFQEVVDPVRLRAPPNQQFSKRFILGCNCPEVSVTLGQLTFRLLQLPSSHRYLTIVLLGLLLHNGVPRSSGTQRLRAATGLTVTLNAQSEDHPENRRTQSALPACYNCTFSNRHIIHCFRRAPWSGTPLTEVYRHPSQRNLLNR